MKKQKGFTLIEVMIVVVIVAILAAVAIPSYQDSVRKTRRADAKEALTRIAALQERYFFTKNDYGTAALLGVGNTSTEGYYTINIYTTPGADTAGGECGADPCYRIVANPVATGPQAADTKCALFTLNHVGQKTAQDASDADTTDECW